MARPEFNPAIHTEKYWCNDCGIHWFSNSMFEDLCPNFHCESDHIYSKTITEKHLNEYNKVKKKINKLKKKLKKVVKLEQELQTFTMLTR